MAIRRPRVASPSPARTRALSSWRRRHRPRVQARDDAGRWALWLSRLLFIALLAVALGLALAMLRGQFHAIVLGILLGSLFRTPHRWLARRLPGWQNLAALLGVAMVVLVLLVPAGVLLSAVIQQGVSSMQDVETWISNGRLRDAVSRVDLAALVDRPVLRHLEQPLARWFDVADLSQVDLTNSRLSEMLGNLGEWLLNGLASSIRPVLAGTGQVLAGFFIMLFVLFFVFRDGEAIGATIRRLLPLARSQEEVLFGRIRDVVRAVVFGTAITALAQGLAGMVAFRAVGIPSLFWGTVMAVASLVPAVGTALVWVPAVGYLLLVGRTGPALFLGLWCLIVVGSIDNLLRPLVMRGRSGMSSLAVFFSIVGGVQLFGPMGLVYGPLVFGLCAVCLYIYEIDNAAFLARQDRL